MAWLTPATLSGPTRLFRAKISRDLLFYMLQQLDEVNEIILAVIIIEVSFPGVEDTESESNANI